MPEEQGTSWHAVLGEEQVGSTKQWSRVCHGGGGSPPFYVGPWLPLDPLLKHHRLFCSFLYTSIYKGATGDAGSCEVTSI